MQNAIYRWYVTELYTWSLYNPVNQCHPGRFNNILKMGSKATGAEAPSRVWHRVQKRPHGVPRERWSHFQTLALPVWVRFLSFWAAGCAHSLLSILGTARSFGTKSQVLERVDQGPAQFPLAHVQQHSCHPHLGTLLTYYLETGVMSLQRHFLLQ